MTDDEVLAEAIAALRDGIVPACPQGGEGDEPYITWVTDGENGGPVIGISSAFGDDVGPVAGQCVIHLLGCVLGAVTFLCVNHSVIFAADLKETKDEKEVAEKESNGE